MPSSLVSIVAPECSRDRRILLYQAPDGATNRTDKVTFMCRVTRPLGFAKADAVCKRGPSPRATSRKTPAYDCLLGYKLCMFRAPAMILAATAMLLLTLAFVAPLSAGELSFACRMTKSARAMATCADPQLAAADIDLEAAYESTLARVDAETTSALREDQRKFIADLDRGFESSVWGKADPPLG